MGNNQILNIDNSEKVQSAARGDMGRDLQTIVHLALVNKLSEDDNRARDELIQVQGRQKRMHYLNQLTKALNSADDGSGSVDTAKHPEIQKLRDKGIQMGQEADDLIAQAEALEKEVEDLKAAGVEQTPEVKNEIKKKEKEAKVLRDDAAEMKDIAASIVLITGDANNLVGDKKLTKEQKTALMENLRTTFDDLNSIHQLQMQKMNRINNERHETLLMARMIVKTLHESIKHMANSISSR